MRKSSEIKRLLVVVFFLIIAAIVGLIVFLANVKVATIEQDNENLREEEVEKTSYAPIEVDNIITSMDNEQAQFKLYDSNGIFSVELEDKKVKFSIVDEEKFNKEFPNAKFNKGKKEIATHDYKIKDVFIGIINGEDYVIVITGDGKIGSMNVKEAVEENALRIKNELQSFDQKIAFIQKVTISDGNMPSFSDAELVLDKYCKETIDMLLVNDLIYKEELVKKAD